MSDEQHMIWFSDQQDAGLWENNVGMMDQAFDFIAANYNPDNTHLLLGGDLLDAHAFNNMKYDPAEFSGSLEAKFTSEDSDKTLKKVFGLTDEKLASAKPEELMPLRYMAMGQEYAIAAATSVGKLAQKGYDISTIVGNNEPMVLDPTQQSLQKGGPQASKQIADQYRGLLEKVGGVKSIDTGVVTNMGGLKVFSDSYVAHPGIDYNDAQSTDEGSLCAKIEKVMANEDSPNVLAFHGNPFRDDKATGIRKAIDTYSHEDPLFVFSGHYGKPGIEVMKNENGSAVISVNGNNTFNADGTEWIMYDSIIKDGKITEIKEYWVSYKN